MQLIVFFINFFNEIRIIPGHRPYSGLIELDTLFYKFESNLIVAKATKAVIELLKKDVLVQGDFAPNII